MNDLMRRRPGRRWGVMLAIFCLAGALAQADTGNGNPNDTGNGGEGNHYGWGDGIPAAPEPGVVAMAVGGLLLAGGYTLYRLRRSSRKGDAPAA